MNTSLPHSETLERSNFGDHQNPPRSTVSWGAIFAGAVAALALHVLFMMLGAGLGLAIYSPVTEDNPVANLSIGALIIHSTGAIIALCLGGWVAGRFSPVAARATGWLHGFSVWCAATVGGVILVALGAGAMVGGLSNMVGGGLASVGQPAADLAADALNQSGETITSYVDEAVGNLPEDGLQSDSIRAKREVGFAVARLFNPTQEGNTAANRSAAVTALVNHADMTQADAERTVTEWTNSYDRMQSDLTEFKETAATQAREAADSTADAVSTFSLWAFVGFMLGALGATWGGHLGAKCATRCDDTPDGGHSAHVTSSRPIRRTPADGTEPSGLPVTGTIPSRPAHH